MENRKVNWKNVGIVFAVTIFGIIIGLVDRIVNHIRPIEDIFLIISSFSHSTSIQTDTQAWYNSSVTLASTTSSAFSWHALIIIAVIGFASIIVMSTTFSYAGNSW